jgi:excinuclease ABC subunit C
MREVISRRFSHVDDNQNWPSPDLVLIDGGRGQLSAVLAAFADLGLSPPPIAGIAKDRDDHGPDRIFLPGRKNPADLKPGSAALMLLAKLRDEAHRFCRTYHHALRTKEMLSSSLIEVKGLGKKRLQALINHYPTLEDINKASDEDLIRLTKLAPEPLLDLRNKIQALMAAPKSQDPGPS